MREIDWRIVPDNGVAVLLTMHDIMEQTPLLMADFRDTHALVFKKTGHFIGLTRSRGVRLCKKWPNMRDGIWYVNEDFDVQKIYKNVELRPEHLILGIIQ